MTEEKPFNQLAYQNEYKKKNYDSIEVLVPKGQKQIIKEMAKKNGLSTSAYIYNAIRQQLELEKDF